MPPSAEIIIFHHGTTLRRAERLLVTVPDPHYIEPHGDRYTRAEGFSGGIAGTPPGRGLESPEEYARRKANLFPAEGGPVILEVEVPGWIVDIVRNDWVLGPVVDSGELRFYPGFGLEELQREWPTLPKRVIPL